MEALNNDIRESIAKNLPQAVGEELRKRLEQADKDANALGRALDNLSSKNLENAELRAKVALLEEKLKKHGDLDKRIEEVSKREHAADLNDLKVQLESANANTKFARDVAMGLVRNTEFRSAVFETVAGRSHVIPGANGMVGYIGNAPGPESTTTNTTKTAT